MELGISKKLTGDFATLLERVEAAFAAEGFGLLTEVDVRATLCEKLDVDFREYRVLGFCNPPFAHRALEISLDAGLLMPCNVTVYADGEGGVVVTAIDMTKAIGGLMPQLQPLAEQVTAKMRTALEKLV